MAVLISSDAEQKAIVTLLSGEEELRGLLLAVLDSQYFGLDQSIECVARIQALIKANSPLPSADMFKDDPTLSDDAKVYLDNIQFEPLRTVDDVNALIKVLDLHRKRRLIVTGCKEVLSDIKNTTSDTVDTPATKLEELVMNLHSEHDTVKLLVAGAGDSSQADEIVENLIANQVDSNFLKTGFKYFDGRAGGFKRSNLVVIAGPTHGGKSVMRTQLAKNMYMDGHLSTAIVSFEMSKEEEMLRLLSNISQVPLDRIDRKMLSAMQQAKIFKAWDDFKDTGKTHNNRFVFWVPDGELSASQIVQYLKPLKLDVVVIDYIGLLGQDNRQDAQWESLGRAAREFKIAAQSLNACIILLAQFDAENQRVKYARAIKEHANIMWGWQYGEKEQTSGIVTICQTAPIGKNRNCLPFDFKLHFQLETMTITDFEGFEDAPQTDGQVTEVSAPKQAVSKKPNNFVKFSKDLKETTNKTFNYKPPRTPQTPSTLDEDEEV